MSMMSGSDWGGWIAGALTMVVFWGGIAALVVFLARGSGARPSQREDKPRTHDAQEILAERFARGEISGDEFDERRRVLERGGVG
jgi:putative membrane protein